MKNTATELDRRVAAAAALAKLLPSTSELSAGPSIGDPTDGATTAVVASFVGERSADLAVVLVDAQAMADASGSDLVSLADVLRPALEAAAVELGNGVLGEVRVDDASALFADVDTEVFSLDNGGQLAGWLPSECGRTASSPAPPHSARSRWSASSAASPASRWP